jgi:hypothetical protein
MLHDVSWVLYCISFFAVALIALEAKHEESLLLGSNDDLIAARQTSLVPFSGEFEHLVLIRVRIN